MAETTRSIPDIQRRDQAELPRGPFPWVKVLSYTALIIGMLIALLPFVWMINWSLMGLSEVVQGRFIPSELHFENYVQAWQEGNLQQFTWNSVRITAIIIVGRLLFCIPAAYAFARMRFVGRNVIFALMLSTLMIPDIVTLIPNFLTVTWISRLSQNIFGPSGIWINNWPALTIPFMASAFSIFLLRQFFAQIPQDLWDAARIDGAGHVAFLLRVVIPLSKAPIMTVVTFAFIGAWNMLIWPLMVVPSDPTWRPIAHGLAQFTLENNTGYFHLQMAGSVITILPVLALYFVAQKQFTEG
ncbi:MAG: carbohydrate ABC transporter permease [Chloroflexi bacterium]|nr:carbohydrate ABC transporter permease [Chloroflexota bacterium]